MPQPARDDDDRALELGYRALSARDRTCAQLRAWLERKRLNPRAIERAVDELTRAGFLDDVRFARRFAQDKRELEGWGAQRIERELRRRGVAAEIVTAVAAPEGRDAELAGALEVLARRVAPPANDRERDRAWRLLVRRGYEPELAYEAVRAYGRGRAA